MAERSLYCIVLLELPFFKLKAAFRTVLLQFNFACCTHTVSRYFVTHQLTVASPTQQNFVHRPAWGSNIIYITCYTLCGCQGTAHPGSSLPISCYMMASHTPHLQCSQLPLKFNNSHLKEYTDFLSNPTCDPGEFSQWKDSESPPLMGNSC